MSLLFGILHLFIAWLTNLPLKNIPVGSSVHNIEMKPGAGGQLARSAGTSAQIENFFFESDSTLTWWERTKEVKYGFCSNCGSSLFWEDRGRTESRAITAGVLDPPTGLKTVLNIFSNLASDYHHLDEEIKTTSGDLPGDQKADRSN